MAYDKQQRNRLEKLTQTTKDLLVADYLFQVQSLYGFQKDGTFVELDQLGHLAQEELQTASLLRQEILHLSDRRANEKNARGLSFEQLLNEQAFTTLNRLAALRMAEERRFIQTALAKGFESAGFQMFRQIAGVSLGSEFETYRTYLFLVFDELAVDLGALFDRWAPSGLLFPQEATLIKVLAELNHPEVHGFWKEDETIGWMYQFFNSLAERQALRKASPSGPRNSRELAVLNQFFTPRYVVQFLTDNTLGRQWAEMTGGQTKLSLLCEFLLPSNEHRELKNPKEIRLLDPACGSMHFGLYAYDLFEVIYEEGWERGLLPEFESREALKAQIPVLILAHNIHGMDIDRRAAQIAGLSLWLRAQRSFAELGLKPKDRPRITKAQVVCAEPMPGERDYLEEFILKLKPQVLGDLVRELWSQMRLAGDAGSLLRLEDSLSRQIEGLRSSWEAYRKERKSGAQTTSLFEEDQRDHRFEEIKQGSLWDQLEARVLEELKEFAETSGSGGYRRNLFAEEAAAGLGLLDLCRKKYDVVVMNPPFGASATGAKSYIGDEYPNTKSDLATAFLEMGLNRLVLRGSLGAITTRTIFFLSSHTKFREEVALKKGKPLVFADLGGGVLDAMVETAAYVLEKQ